MLLFKILKAANRIAKRASEKEDDNKGNRKSSGLEGMANRTVGGRDAIANYLGLNKMPQSEGYGAKGMGDTMDELTALEGFAEVLAEEMGARGDRGDSRRSGKGRHAGSRTRSRQTRAERKAGKRAQPLSSQELRDEAGLVKPGQRYDNGDIFQAWNANKDFWVRTGTEVFMGMDDALTTILAGTIGTFEAAPNKEFEIQDINIQVVGAGATAAATVAIHNTLLANLAFSYINVGDDKMITGANYVGAHTLNSESRNGDDLAGFVATPTQKLSIGVLDAAAYNASVFITACGELCVLYGL